jgi:hypothetical protein
MVAALQGLVNSNNSNDKAENIGLEPFDEEEMDYGSDHFEEPDEE